VAETAASATATGLAINVAIMATDNAAIRFFNDFIFNPDTV